MKRVYKIGSIIILVVVIFLIFGYRLTHTLDINVFVEKVYENDNEVVLVLNTTSSGLNFDSYKLTEIAEGEYALEVKTVLAGLGGKSWPQAVVVSEAQSVTLTNKNTLCKIKRTTK